VKGCGVGTVGNVLESCWIGIGVGRRVGLDVGVSVGPNVGAIVGRGVGLEVGAIVGRVVGLEVGAIVGRGVDLGIGASVGSGVGAEPARVTVINIVASGAPNSMAMPVIFS
jgi:hypothetical protein